MTNHCDWLIIDYKTAYNIGSYVSFRVALSELTLAVSYVQARAF